MIYFPKNNPMIYDHENITIKKCIRKKKTSEHVINLKLHVSMTDYWNQKETNAPGGGGGWSLCTTNISCYRMLANHWTCRQSAELNLFFTISSCFALACFGWLLISCVY